MLQNTDFSRAEMLSTRRRRSNQGHPMRPQILRPSQRLLLPRRHLPSQPSLPQCPDASPAEAAARIPRGKATAARRRVKMVRSPLSEYFHRRSIPLYNVHTVLPSSGIRMVNVNDQLFCCGLGCFDSSTGTCYNSAGSSDAPFPVDSSYVMFNRTSGSTSPNSTATTTSTVTIAAATIKAGDTTTATATAIGTAASPPSTSDKAATAGAAVGFPLGLALLGVVGMLWRQKRQASGLRKAMMDREEKYIARLESKMETRRTENVHYSCNETPTAPSARTWNGWRAA